MVKLAAQVRSNPSNSGRVAPVVAALLLTHVRGWTMQCEKVKRTLSANLLANINMEVKHTRNRSVPR